MIVGRILLAARCGRRGSPLSRVALLWTVVAAVALTFPALTGRVVDQANVISADAKRAIEPKLADLEAKSGIQLVVATVSSLEGQEIEPYANALFREWKLGEKAKNNGVLLLVAPNEHRVRIEVGYGLEGTLTDALGKVIITNAITPRFKTGDFSGGISRGVDDIITVLTTDSSEWEKRPALRVDNPPAQRPGQLAHRSDCHRRHRAADRLARLSLVLLQRRAEHPAEFGQQRRILAAAAVADFPAAEVRQAAAERRGAGDGHFGRGPQTDIRTPSTPPRRGPRARSSACWRNRPSPPRPCRCSSPHWARSCCRGCW